MPLKNKIKQLIFAFISKSKFLNTSLKNNYVSRWIILGIDIFIVSFVTVFSYFIIYQINIEFVSDVPFLVRYTYIVVMYSISFLIFKPYRGIIRHATFKDAIKILISTTTVFLFLAAVNFLADYYFKIKIHLFQILLLSYVLSFMSLFSFRIFITYLFQFLYVENAPDTLARALIYGTDVNAIFLANILNTESPKRFKVVGFVSNNKATKAQTILDLPILNLSKKTNVLLRVMKASVLIIAEKNLNQKDTIAIVEECLEYSYKVYTLQDVTNWEDKSQVSKGLKSFKIEDLLARNPIVLSNAIISEQLSKKTILITGAAGSIGSEIVRQVLLFAPKTIILVDQAETPLHQLALEIEAKLPSVTIRNAIADVKDYDAMHRLFEQYQPNVVFHAAGYKHVPMMEENPDQAILTNVIGTKNVVDLAQMHGVDRFIMISTDKAVNPSSVMGASKRIAEMYVQSKYFSTSANATKKNTKFITTRFGNVLGSNGSVVPLFTQQIQEGGPITITHPDMIRYFMTIPEACQLVLEACSMGNGGEIYIFDMGKPVKIMDLAKNMIRLAGLKPEMDIKIKIIGLRPGEKLYEELLTESSKTVHTYHQKILIATDSCPELQILNETIDTMKAAILNSQKQEIVAIMKGIIPEFKSLNSVFQALD